jgi:hypothetical protein
VFYQVAGIAHPGRELMISENELLFLLRRLRNWNVCLSLEGGNLCCWAPREWPPLALLDALEQARHAVITVMKEASQ